MSRFRYTRGDADLIAEIMQDTRAWEKKASSTNWGQHRGHFSPGVYRVFTEMQRDNWKYLNDELEKAMDSVMDITTFAGTGAGYASDHEHESVRAAITEACALVRDTAREIDANIDGLVWEPNSSGEAESRKLVKELDQMESRLDVLYQRWRTMRREAD